MDGWMGTWWREIYEVVVVMGRRDGRAAEDE
jgi:hypothetical protein